MLELHLGTTALQLVSIISCIIKMFNSLFSSLRKVVELESPPLIPLLILFVAELLHISDMKTENQLQ